MMRYTTKKIKETGIRFELEQGTPRELYTTITDKLKEYFTDINTNVDIPNAPNFESLPLKQSILKPLILSRGSGETRDREGIITLNYFKRGTDLKSSNDSDYTETIGKKISYQAISIFFKTTPPGMKKENISWANETQRDIFLASIEDKLI